MKRSILKNPHESDCDAVDAVNRGDWDTPWYLTGDVEYLDKRGRIKGHYRWHVAVCNNTSCDANLLMSPELIDNMLVLAEAKES
ncbi:hypothetical protein [Mycobacteroides abscessus]|uniref:hypothetical protein n=1 Tax=Mycobacteroides abscessus TaxID=36809 RepID=UPI00092BFD6B|nr:hypothetical protein [Mycobacteroides abscessus]SIC59524.1 Uncharacterised protein [Mycobacteroides abscessus subsp. abscessus]